MATHKEIGFEDVICDHLAAHGWLYAKGDAAAYDREHALFPADLVAWATETQAKPWAAAVAALGEKALLDRIRKSLDDRGTLEVLRKGVEVVGLKAPLMLAQFRPAMGMNPEITARYAANRLRVIRQVRYSLHSEKCIDLVLFLNGIAVATVELKTDFTQSVQDAVDQYRFDRQPVEKGKKLEPLLAFPGAAFVHFAVSGREVMMAARLDGPATRFLPFNKGDNGAAGNPVNPNGHRTAYLWEEIWARDSCLEILGRYLVGERNAKKQLVRNIFPRFHQLDATRKLRAAVLAHGPGGKYLIQHSAGAGKTNSIAWTAHQLADLHDARDEKVFSTVVVVLDRTVIDTQLQEAIFAFERTTGVVETISSESGAKSGQLAKALGGRKKIVVCTIQTFPFALKSVQELAATTGKTFAVIADEAHSSQTGEAASKLKQVLAAEGVEEEIGKEDILAAQMSTKAGSAGISFVAFTATPKAKTLELFGRPPNPDAPTGLGSQRSLLILLDAVDIGTLSLASVGNGFSDLRLRRDEVDLLFCKSEVQETEALIPTTAFGISIGIQDNGRFRKLIDAGHTPATRRRNPRTGLENIYMTPADVAAFHRRFVTVPTLAAETGRTIFELRAELKRAGVAVFSPDGQDFGRLFLREEVEAALERAKERKI